MSDQAAFEEFLQKLAHDDDFRARLQADPAAALGELGIQVPDGLHSGAITLPSKQEVQAQMQDWAAHAQQGSTAMMIFFCLK